MDDQEGVPAQGWRGPEFVPRRPEGDPTPELPRLRQPADAAAQERRGEAGAGRGRGKGPDRAAGKDEGTGCGRRRRGEVAHRPDARVRVGPEEPADAGGPTCGERAGATSGRNLPLVTSAGAPGPSGAGKARPRAKRAALRGGGRATATGPAGHRTRACTLATAAGGEGDGGHRQGACSEPPGSAGGKLAMLLLPSSSSRLSRFPPLVLRAAPRLRTLSRPPCLRLPLPVSSAGSRRFPAPPALRSPQLPPGVRYSRRRASEARVLRARELCSAFQRNCLITD